MAFIVEDIISAFNSAISDIESFFSDVGSYLSGIVNTGQGVAAGLFTYATGIYNSVKYFTDQTVSALAGVGTWLYNTLLAIGTGFLSPFVQIGTWLYSGFYAVGNWFYNAFTLIGQACASFWNSLAGTIETVWNTFIAGIMTWYSDIADTANAYLTNLVSLWRAKMKTTLVADMTLAFGWEGLHHAVSGFSNPVTEEGLLGMGLKTLAAPILGAAGGAVGGLVLGAILDAIIPSTDLNVQLMPTFTFTSTTVSLPRMTAPSGTTPPAPPSGTPTFSDTLSPTEAMLQAVSYTREDSDLVNRAEAELDTVTGLNAYLEGESINRSETPTITNS